VAVDFLGLAQSVLGTFSTDPVDSGTTSLQAQLAEQKERSDALASQQEIEIALANQAAKTEESTGQRNLIIGGVAAAVVVIGGILFFAKK